MTWEPSVVAVAIGAGAVGGFVAARVRRPNWRVAGHRPDPIASIRFLAPARPVVIRPLPRLVVTVDQAPPPPPRPVHIVAQPPGTARRLPPPAPPAPRALWMPPIVPATSPRARSCNACSKTLRSIDRFCSDCGLAVGQQR